jgi:hypothetical protein
MYMYDTHAETAGTMQTRGLDVIRRSTLTRCGLRREAGRGQTVADSGTQHATHNTQRQMAVSVPGGGGGVNRQPPTANRQPSTTTPPDMDGVLFFGGVWARADARGGMSG